MAQTKKLLVVDINEDIHDIIAAKQGDANSRFLDVKLIDNSLPVNLTQHTVRLSAVKQDGRRIYNNCVITDALNGRFQVELTNQMLAVVGKVHVEFTMYGANETQVLTTRTFSIVVLESLFDEGAVASTNEFGAAVVLFQDVAAIREKIYAMSKLIDLNLDATVSSRASQDSVNEIKSTVQRLSTEAVTVKGVQRGAVTLDPYSLYTYINISYVNPAKCAVNLNGTGSMAGRSSYYTILPYIENLTNTVLIIGGSSGEGSGGRISYEIVEYF